MANTPNNPCPWCQVLWMTGIKSEPSPKRDEHTRACNFLKTCLAVATAAGEAAFDTVCGGWTRGGFELPRFPDRINPLVNHTIPTSKRMGGEGDQGGYLTMDYKAMNELIKKNVTGISSAIEKQLKEFMSGMEDEMADTLRSSLDKNLFKSLETFTCAMIPTDPTSTKITPIRHGGIMWNILNQRRPIVHTDKAADPATDIVTETDTDIATTSTATVTASETSTIPATELATTSGLGTDNLTTPTVTACETSAITATELTTTSAPGTDSLTDTDVDTKNATDTDTLPVTSTPFFAVLAE